MRVACFVLVMAIGCGETELTCDLLADEGNCWATAAGALAACMPARATPATLEADRGSCTFSDGVRVVFDAPLPDDTIDLEGLGFSVLSGDQVCGRFVDTFQNRMELTGGGRTVVSELHPGSEFHLHCPDEDFGSSFDRLFECAGQGIPAPTDGFDVTPTSFSFAVTSVTTPGELFRCER